MTISPRLRNVLVIAITAIVFVLLFSRIPFADVVSVLGGARVDLLVVALVLTALFPLLAALRWQVVLNLLGYRISLGLAFTLVMAAWPLGVVTPSKSGDLVRAYYLKDHVPVPLTLGAVLAERAIDVLTLLALSAVGAALFGWVQVLLVSAACLVAGLAAIALLVAHGERLPLPDKIRSKIGDMLRAFRVLAARPGALGVVVGYTLVNWFLSILQTWVLFLALGNPVSLAFTAGALPLALFAGLVPITLAGMGTRDGALVLLYQAQAPPEITLGVGLLYTLYGYWILALAGLPFLKRAFPRGTDVVGGASRETT